jgi:hypothetical protein
VKLTKHKEFLIRQRFKRAIRDHTLMFCTQIAIAAGVAALWAFLIRGRFTVSEGDAEYFLGAVIFLGSASWVLKATEALSVIWDQYREVVEAVKRADREKIIELKDDHIPLLVHFYLSMLGLMTIGVTMILPYREAIDGSIVVFLVTLIFTFYVAIVFELEDPLENKWVRDQLERNCPDIFMQDSEALFANRWRNHEEDHRDLPRQLRRRVHRRVGSPQGARRRRH